MANWVQIRFRCYTCDGTGVYHGSSDPGGTCPECNGEGYVDSRMQVHMQSIENDLKKLQKTCDDILKAVKP